MNQERATVDCDDNCGAYDDPDLYSVVELRAALDHWRNHSLLQGCSHAR